MIEFYIRPVYQRILVDPVIHLFKRFSPEQITWMALISGLLVVPALYFNLLWCAVALLIVSGFLDTVDGSVARLQGTVSVKGSILDIVSDRIVELATITGLLIMDPAHRAVSAFAMLGSCYLCITSFLVVGIFAANHTEKGFYYSPGWIERAEAFIFFIAMILFPAYFYLLVALFVTLVLFTSYHHINRFLLMLRG